MYGGKPEGEAPIQTGKGDEIMSRKFAGRIALVLLAVMLMIGVSPAALAASSASKNGVVKTPTVDGTVYLRRGPGMNYSTVAVAVNGDPLTILGTKGNWSQVKLDRRGKVGYMYSQYVCKTLALKGVSGDVGRVDTRFQGSRVNLRKGAGSSCRVMTSIPKGEKLQILGRKGDWYKVRVIKGGLVGYMSRSYVEKGIPGLTTGNVHMRAGAGTQYKSQRVLPIGTPIQVLRVSKYWSKVQVDGKIGYVSNAYYRV